MGPTTKRQRDSDNSDDERPCKSAKFEARDYFLLTLERKKKIAEKKRKRQLREQADALETYRAIILASSKLPSKPSLKESQIISYSIPKLPWLPLIERFDSAFKLLNDDCLLQIMQHIRLMPDMCNLLTVSNRCRGLWKACKESMVKSIQRTQFPEYLEMFGELGQQSNEQVYNLLCAQATEYYRTDESFREPERQSFMRYYGHDASLYQQGFFVFLEKLDNGFNEQVTNLHESMSLYSSSRHITKAAVITLWIMGWKRPRRNGNWIPGPRIYPSLYLDSMSGLLEQQSEEVRERIKCIMSALSHDIVDRSRDLCHCAWHWIFHQEKQGQPLNPYDPRQWVAEALSGIITIEIIFEGIDKAMAGLRQEYTPHVAHRQTLLDQCYNKMWHDRTGIEVKPLLYLKEQLYITRKLGVSFIWEDLVEVWEANLGGCSGVTCLRFPRHNDW